MTVAFRVYSQELIGNPQSYFDSFCYISPMLFCKPSSRSRIHFENLLASGETIQLRSLDLKTDLALLRHSAEKPERIFSPFHPGSLPSIGELRAQFLSPYCHWYTAQVDEQISAIIFLSQLSTDELGNFLRSRPHDCVVRFYFLGPFSTCNNLLTAFQRYYFQFTESGGLYADPDIHHSAYCRLLERSGFAFYRNVMLRVRAASVYVGSREGILRMDHLKM